MNNLKKSKHKPKDRILLAIKLAFITAIPLSAIAPMIRSDYQHIKSLSASQRLSYYSQSFLNMLLGSLAIYLVVFISYILIKKINKK